MCFRTVFYALPLLHLVSAQVGLSPTPTSAAVRVDVSFFDVPGTYELLNSGMRFCTRTVQVRTILSRLDAVTFDGSASCLFVNTTLKRVRLTFNDDPSINKGFGIAVITNVDALKCDSSDIGMQFWIPTRSREADFQFATVFLERGTQYLLFRRWNGTEFDNLCLYKERNFAEPAPIMTQIPALTPSPTPAPIQNDTRVDVHFSDVSGSYERLNSGMNFCKRTLQVKSDGDELVDLSFDGSRTCSVVNSTLTRLPLVFSDGSVDTSFGMAVVGAVDALNCDTFDIGMQIWKPRRSKEYNFKTTIVPLQGGTQYLVLTRWNGTGIDNICLYEESAEGRTPSLTPSLTPTSSSTNSTISGADQGPGKPGNSIWVILGPVIGAVIIVILAVIGLWFYFKGESKESDQVDT